MDWRICERFPAYEVSESGDVRRIATGRVLKSYQPPRGYPMVCLYRDKSRASISTAILVAEAFIGSKPFAEAEVCHCDGTRTNNHFSNLRWGSVQSNAADRKIHETELLGERNGQAKLTEADVLEIRRLKSGGARQIDISAQFSVSPSVISDILNRKLWAHVS